MYHTSAGNCANQIVPGVFLSDLATALDPAELARLGITHVLSVIDFEPSGLPAHVTHMHVRIEDRFDADLLRHLPTTTEFIRSALAERDDAAVLVHCMMGISRSATVVCAYLVAEHGMSARDAITHTKSKRPVVRPNSGFERQLGVWARQFATPVPSPQQQQRDGAGMHLLRERLRRILDASGGAQAGQKRMATAAVRS